MESPSIADLAEQASKAVMKQYELAAQNQNQNKNQAQTQTQTYQPSPSNTTTFAPAPTEHERGVPAGSDFISDPYLYMRIFSLPILESLVRALLDIILAAYANKYSLHKSCRLWHKDHTARRSE